MEYEEMAQDIVNIKVTSGDSKAEVKKPEMMKAEKNGNISTDIEQFRMERTSFCSTKIINMDASTLLAKKKKQYVPKRTEHDFTFGANPPPSPRSSRDLYAEFLFPIVLVVTHGLIYIFEIIILRKIL